MITLVHIDVKNEDEARSFLNFSLLKKKMPQMKKKENNTTSELMKIEMITKDAFEVEQI